MVHKKIPKHIEIVRSNVSALNSLGTKSCNALYRLLRKHYTTVGVTVVNTLADLEALVAKQPDLVFIGTKQVPGAIPGSHVWLADYLKQHNISHTGSPKEAMRLEQDKPLAKQRVHEVGLQTSPYLVVQKGQQVDIASTSLRFPLFVKPTGLGAGLGVDDHSVVRNQAQFDAKVRSLAATYDADSLVEEYLSGREFSVAILRQQYSDELLVMPLELLAGADVHGDHILSHKLKAAALETPVQPVTDPALRKTLTDLAANCFMALGARDYGRIDIRLDASGTPHFLEANLIPCLIEGSGNFPKACVMNLDMNYETMILHIVNLGLARASAFATLEDDQNDLMPLHHVLPVPA